MNLKTFGVPELAEQLHVSQNKILQWIDSGELVAHDLSARRGRRPRYRVLAADLEKFLASRATKKPESQKAPARRGTKNDKAVIEFF